jgi:GTP pyrophosphokinase
VFEEKIASFNEKDRERILSARAWAGEHGGGDSEGAASILADLGLDADTITAALILNSPEQGADTDIEQRFGKNVALLAEGTARISGLKAKNKTLQEAENIRKMLFAMVKDIRIIFIKLADKLWSMREAGNKPAEERKQAAQESLDIYAPLAGRLGISWIKDELEDLALKELNREAYLQIKDIVSEKRGERREFLNKVQEDIQREAKAAGIGIEVSSRAKHFYSIYQKIRKRDKSAADIYDLFGIRIICDSIETCYTLLGMVHRLWKPLDGRFKDYIAMPKSNGYQSLHTTVMVPGNSAVLQDTRTVEIQIRTREMHHIAENGIASHWLYKKGSSRELVRPVDITIVNRLKDWKETEDGSRENFNSKTFLEEIKREILRDSIYVFTPQGKVVELPAGSTPIDFAYAIHSAIGDRCAGAKANGAIIPLNSELANTQVVEILTSQQARPHVNWLRIVKTSKARSKIRAWLEQHDETANQEKTPGKRKAKNQETEKKNTEPEASTVPAMTENQPFRLEVKNNTPGGLSFKVRIQDEKNMLIRFASCCKPITGDPITGYISRTRGIIIHRTGCRNLLNIADLDERRIDAEWDNASVELLRRFTVDARAAPNLFSEIEGAIRKYHGHLIEGRFEEKETNKLTGSFVMQLESPEDVKKIMKGIRGIPGVYKIRTVS